MGNSNQGVKVACLVKGMPQRGAMCGSVIVGAELCGHDGDCKHQFRTMTLEQFQSALKAQEVPREHMAIKCPMCKTVQSATDLIAAGAGGTFEEVERVLGFSCVGRWLGAESPRAQPDGKPCNWTLGGLFHTHRLEVVTEDGKRHPVFEPATPEEAKAHMVPAR